MKKLMLMVAAVAAVCTFATAPKQADARPKYVKAFTVMYDIAEAKEKKCLICHGTKEVDGKTTKDVKVRSDYGKALAKALGKKNVKLPADIAKGLEEAAKAKTKDGKAFGDFMKDGKLPPAAE